MSTNFDTSFDNGEFIDSNHLSQYVDPINDLESGATHFRASTNDSGNYQVDFQNSANPNGHSLEVLTAGQKVVFKASHTCADNAELKVLVNGGFFSHPLFLAGTSIRAGEITSNQVVEAIYNDTTTPRFDVQGIRTSKQLSDITDVSLSSPTTGQTLRHDGTEFTNATIEIGDVDGLATAITNAGGTTTGHLQEIQALNLSQGDMLTTNASGEIVKLPLGTEGQVLKMTLGVPAWGEDLGGGGDAGADIVAAGLVASGYQYENISSTSVQLRSSAFVPILDEHYLIRYFSNHTSSVSQLDLAGARTNGQDHYCRAEETGSSTSHDIGFSSSGGGDYLMDVEQRSRPVEFVWKANTTNEVEIVLGQPTLTYGEFTGTILVYRLRSKVAPLGWGAYSTGFSWLENATNTGVQVGQGTYRQVTLDSSKTYAVVGNWTVGYTVALCLHQGGNYWRLPPNSSTFSTVSATQAAWSGATYNEAQGTAYKGGLIRYFTPPGTGVYGLGCSFYAIKNACFFLLEVG